MQATNAATAPITGYCFSPRWDFRVDSGGQYYLVTPRLESKAPAITRRQRNAGSASRDALVEIRWSRLAQRSRGRRGWCLKEDAKNKDTGGNRKVGEHLGKSGRDNRVLKWSRKRSLDGARHPFNALKIGWHNGKLRRTLDVLRRMTSCKASERQVLSCRKTKGLEGQKGNYD